MTTTGACVILRAPKPEGPIPQYHLPCPCGRSSDAYTLYEDGHGFCYSCDKPTFSNKKDNILDKTTLEYLPFRGVSAVTMRKFGCKTVVDAEGKPILLGYPYGTEGAVKYRHLDQKKFFSEGEMSKTGLFGMEVFSAGSSKAITITEGEQDALSVYEILGHPVVSVHSASSAKKDCAAAHSYLDSFEKIYLCFDNDEHGEKAAVAVASLFDFNKIYHVKMTKFKDASDYLQAGAVKEFTNVWWNSKRFLPEHILSSFQEFDGILDSDTKKETFPFPFKTLQEMTYGLPLGEVVLVTAQEGVGKTEIIRAMEFKLLKETDDNIGTIHLEEDKARQLKGLAGYELGVPAHLPDSSVSSDDIKAALRRIVTRDDRLHIYSHFGSDDPDTILSMIRFMVAVCGCKYIFLDHITMVVTGLESDDERKTLDLISTRLAMMVKELNFCLVLVSHVNDDNKTRGSRNISKIATTWVHLDRDLEATDEITRNTTTLIVKKNRLGGRTGFAGDLYFDLETYLIGDKPDSLFPKAPELPA